MDDSKHIFNSDFPQGNDKILIDDIIKLVDTHKDSFSIQELYHKILMTIFALINVDVPHSINVNKLIISALENSRRARDG